MRGRKGREERESRTEEQKGMEEKDRVKRRKEYERSMKEARCEGMEGGRWKRDGRKLHVGAGRVGNGKEARKVGVRGRGRVRKGKIEEGKEQGREWEMEGRRGREKTHVGRREEARDKRERRGRKWNG